MRQVYRCLVLTFVLLLRQPAGAAGQDGQGGRVREALMELIDSAWTHGLDSGRYAQEIRDLRQGEKPWADVAFGFLKDLRSGYGIAELVNYDGISPALVKKEDEELMVRLTKVHTGVELKELADSFVPRSAIYDTLRAALEGVSCDTSKARQLAAALNLYRWIHHFHWRRCIVVSIADARLTYYEQDTVRLQMRIVAGEPSKRTPRLADAMNIQLFDKAGKVVDPSSISWWRWNKKNFPYSMRQSTGCDNALGVIKFNLTSPFDVYMHDTNFKISFLRSYRWLSHGCIRLEKPIELGNLLLDHQLDTALLQSCLKDQQPRSLRLEEPVPVFVIYQTAVIGNGGKLRLVKDIYHLMN